jgi:hypothetical protein
MTPTVLQITGSANVDKFCTTLGRERCVTSFIMDEIIYPPKNIAGKQCLVEATYCNFETAKPLSATEAANQQVYFAWNVNSLWSQMYTEPNFPMLTPALGVRDLANGLFYKMGSRVVRINDGPFPVKFLCYQQQPSRYLTGSFYNYWNYDRYIVLGANPYVSVTINNTNNVLIVGGNSVTIPDGTYGNIGLMVAALGPLLKPLGYTLTIDGNTQNTRLVISRKDVGTGGFDVGGTAQPALGFQTGASFANADSTIMTVMLHITPIE